MPSMIECPVQLQAAAAWGSLCSVQEPATPRRALLIPVAPATKKPAAYAVRRRNLETCTEALGCETGAVDTTAPAGNGFFDDSDGGGSFEAERKRRARADEDEVAAKAGRLRRSASDRRGPLPPPLTTLARGAGRVRMVHERRDGRLEVYAVRAPAGVLEAERGGGRLRLRLLPLSSPGCGQEQQGPDQAEEEVYGFSSNYVRGGRCVENEGGAAATRRGKPWELELCQYSCIF